MEEKIIDGVNVSECKYYHYKGCSATGLRCENCTCYYKQLKRLEQENKNLKEELATERLYNSQIEEFEESLHKLKEENEEYIQTIQKFMDNAGIECDDDEQELRTLPNAGTCLFKLRLENDDLKQTIKDLTQSLDDCNVQRTQLKKENEELKEEYQQAHDDFIDMNEIEKLYKNAGIKNYRLHSFVGFVPNGYKAVCYEDNPNKVKEVVREFTAKKQVELIKWLAKKDCMYRLTYERDFLWCSQLEWRSSFCYEEFEESLANLINTIWQDLTEEERKQIKEILE